MAFRDLLLNNQELNRVATGGPVEPLLSTQLLEVLTATLISGSTFRYLYTVQTARVGNAPTYTPAAEGADIVNVRQGYGTLSAPMKRLEALVLDGKLRCNHPIMDWCAANCAVQSDHQGNIKPSKAKSTERIDGIAALVTAMAVQAAAETPPPEQDWNIISV